MEEDEKLATLMRGLRGQNLSDSLIAEDDVQLRLVEVDESSDFLPLVYDPASITAYWGKRPRAVATRIVQLLSIAGGFLSRIALDVINKKVKEDRWEQFIWEVRKIPGFIGNWTKLERFKQKLSGRETLVRITGKWLLENDISDVLDLTFSIDADEEKLILYERTEVTDYELIPDIDLDDLRANTEYSGYSAASPVIQWFWEFVQDFSKEDKARLLQFERSFKVISAHL